MMYNLIISLDITDLIIRLQITDLIIRLNIILMNDGSVKFSVY